MVETRFHVLRIIATLFKVLAWIMLIVGALISIGLLIGGLAGGASMTRYMGSPPLGGLVGGVLGGLVAAVISFLFTLLYFAFMYGLGEAIYLGLAIEENTRATSALIRRSLPAPPIPPPPVLPRQS